MKRKKRPLTHEQMNNQNYRYKKKSPPVDEFAHLNGEVKIIVPATKIIQTPKTKVTRSPYIPKHIRDIMREE